MKIYEGCGNTFVMAEEMIDAEKICQSEDTDGFILVDSENLKMEIYNRDGTRAALCVNGLRCFVQYCFDQRYIDKKEVQIETDSGFYGVRILYYYPFLCEVTLPLPRIETNHVYMGNHHMILFNRHFDLGEYYSQLHDCNVNFVRIMHENRISVITYERGVGFTNSCGSGAIASAYYAYLHKLCEDRSEVLNKGGRLLIEISDQITLTGESRYVKDI